MTASRIVGMDGQGVPVGQPEVEPKTFEESLAFMLEQTKVGSSKHIQSMERLLILVKLPEVKEAIDIVMSLGIGQQRG